jgi:hypothetical protein
VILEDALGIALIALLLGMGGTYLDGHVLGSHFWWGAVLYALGCFVGLFIVGEK